MQEFPEGFDDATADAEAEPPTADPPPRPAPEAVTEDGRTVADVNRENVFLRANVDLDSKVGKLMLRSYDGPLTKEAVAAEAEELGCLRTAGVPQEQASSAEAVERAEFASGAEPPTSTPQKHPQDAAREAGIAELMRGGTDEDAIRAGFNVLVESAIRGDDRALVKPPPVH